MNNETLRPDRKTIESWADKYTRMSGDDRVAHAGPLEELENIEADLLESRNLELAENRLQIWCERHGYEYLHRHHTS